MSFDLFVVVPKISVELARSYNQYTGSERPADLEFDLATCEDGSACWELRQNGETWLELYPNRDAGSGYTHTPPELAGANCELHIPCDGQPAVFRIAAILAKLGSGMVMDPQGSSEEVEIDVPADQTENVKYGFYTPTLTLQVADYMEKNFKWD
jgi:hypothetical protein